jgi:acetolactate synthase-1/2/3 large subunit
VSARPSTGAELLCSALEAAGVQCVFGVPGTQSVPLYEALRRSRVRSVVATHELAAAFMANGYARASGRVAPLLTIPGPGFTYAQTGVAEARHDSIPLVHIAGAPPSGDRPFGFQALDQRAIVGPIVKAALRVDRPEEMGARFAEALATAQAGEPGPVYLEWTREALGPLRAEPLVPSRPGGPAAPPPERLAEVVSAVLAARRPVLLFGQGVAECAELGRRLAEALGAPVLTTGSGRGTLAEDHPLSLAFDFARGRLPALNALLREADLVLALGAKLSSAGTSLFQVDIPRDRLVHVDAGDAVAGATYGARLALVAPVEPVLRALLDALAATSRHSDWSDGEVAARRVALRAGTGEGLAEPAFSGVTPGTAEAFFAALRRTLPRDGIVVSDSGLHQFLLRRHFDVLAPRSLLMPSDFQSMGYAIPAAIGARLASERPVVAVVGDGGFAMSGLELLTAVRERLPLTVVVFNDGHLNLIRLSQLALSGCTEGTDLVNPDFEAFAEAVGARFALVDGDPEGVLRAAVGSDGVSLVEVRMGDSPRIRRMRTKGRLRAAATRVVGSGAVSSLGRLVRR